MNTKIWIEDFYSGLGVTLYINILLNFLNILNMRLNKVYIFVGVQYKNKKNKRVLRDHRDNILEMIIEIYIYSRQDGKKPTK